MTSHGIPIRPRQTIGCDLYEKGKDYLILADYFSKYFEIKRQHKKTGSSIIRLVKSQFARHGIPDREISDGLPFGSREFPEYSRSYEFEHVTSSLRYAKSDCKAENSICKDCEFEATFFQVRNRRERSISCTLGSTQLS